MEGPTHAGGIRLGRVLARASALRAVGPGLRRPFASDVASPRKAGHVGAGSEYPRQETGDRDIDAQVRPVKTVAPEPRHFDALHLVGRCVGQSFDQSRRQRKRAAIRQFDHQSPGRGAEPHRRRARLGGPTGGPAREGGVDLAIGSSTIESHSSVSRARPGSPTTTLSARRTSPFVVSSRPDQGPIAVGRDQIDLGMPVAEHGDERAHDRRQR